jgi:acetaldehyde dehydrogenase
MANVTKLCAIIGSGNIGTDLMIKVLRGSKRLECAVLVGVDPESDGLARAKRLGVDATHAGIDGLLDHPRFADVEVIFDATSAKAHLHHAPILAQRGKRVVDLTPAAVGPYVVPVVNLREQLSTAKPPRNVNMTTCGGQATIPMVHAVARVGPVPYAEIVASIASKSAGPGTRANIDEFTVTTARALEEVGGADRGKAIIVLNPAEPPVIMRDTVYAFTESQDDISIAASIRAMAEEVRSYVPGYRLKQDPVFDEVTLAMPGEAPRQGLKVTVFLEVEGAGHYLPKYAGNLDIMTSAALKVGEEMVAS